MKSMASRVGTAVSVVAFLGAVLGTFGLVFAFLPTLVVLNPDWELLRECFALAGPAGILATYQFFGEQAARRGGGVA